MGRSKVYPLSRSPELMRQPPKPACWLWTCSENLSGCCPEHRRIIWNIRRLLERREAFRLAHATATEQYPQGLGPTTAELSSRLGTIAAKTAFSCAACDAIAGELERLPVRQWLVVGIEAHVCVLQTVMDLLSAGFRVFVAVDAVGSRHEIDCRVALARMESSGATLTTCESALFEWCADSSAPQFKQLSQLIKETPPNV